MARACPKVLSFYATGRERDPGAPCIHDRLRRLATKPASKIEGSCGN